MTDLKTYQNRYNDLIVQAILLTDETKDDVYAWVETYTAGSFDPEPVISGEQAGPLSGVSISPEDGRMMISTPAGFHLVSVGDYVVLSDGVFYPYEAKAFEDTYQEIS